jgi:hypothetical protein
VRQALTRAGLKFLPLVAVAWLLASTPVSAQGFFPLKDVRPGLHGIGRTVFQGNRIEEFQVEILGVLQNAGPKQSIILAKLSGGPLAEAGVIQGMSGSPVFIDGKLLGAVALGFAFSKEPIAGIQPIEQMVEDSRFTNGSGAVQSKASFRHTNSWGQTAANLVESAANVPSLFGSLTQILTPVALTGFTPATIQAFSSRFRKLGFEPQQGVSAGSPTSPAFSGNIEPGGMISVQLMSGDMSISADGTVTYIDGKHVYAFGHRFLDGGTTELPFARSEVLAVVPTLNTSFKLSVPKEWIGTITSDRSTGVAGEIGRAAHTIPITISVQSSAMGTHQYHVSVVDDRLFTPFITQTAIFSAIDATERAVGAGTVVLSERIEFEGGVPPIILKDAFVSDSGLPQQVAVDAVVPLGFILGTGFNSLHIKNMSFELHPIESKHQLYISQAWTSAHEVHPGDPVQITTLLAGENGVQMTRSVTYRAPIGAPAGQLNFTVSDANTLNFPDFAGMNASSVQTPGQLVDLLNKYRGSQGAYVRVWRPQPAFTISGPSPGGEITDPPPSVMLVLADPSMSPTSNIAQITTRGSEIAEIPIPIDGYVVSGARTVQVEVKE